jgi:hypothetical protein
LSYYRGFNDVPVPVENYTVQVEDPICNPLDGSDCISGTLQTTTTLAYPRMQVLGLNVAGEAPLFGKIHNSFKPIGYRLEAALVFPERRVMSLMQEEIVFGVITEPAGEYAYPMGERPEVVASTPFPKWVLGLDYTFNRHLYMNTQWVHGFPDEFGAGASWMQDGWVVRDGGVTTEVGDTLGCVLGENGEACAYEIQKPRIGDYLVWGLDIRFLSQAALVRLFAIVDLVGVWEESYDPGLGERVRVHHDLFSSDGFSAIIYPEIQYNFGNGFEMHAGALFQLGKPATKFGAPENGGSMIWTRARYAF